VPHRYKKVSIYISVKNVKAAVDVTV